MARLRFTNRVRVCCNVVLPVEYFSSNGQLCLNCLCQPRGQAHSLTSQPSIEASVRLLELRQDGGEEQTHRCRRRSTSPRLKRSKARHSRFPPSKAFSLLVLTEQPRPTRLFHKNRGPRQASLLGWKKSRTSLSCPVQSRGENAVKPNRNAKLRHFQ